MVFPTRPGILPSGISEETPSSRQDLAGADSAIKQAARAIGIHHRGRH